jgi:uncharacterized protein
MVFTKSPEAGKVKTRLIPFLGAEKSAELYRSMIDRTLRTCRKSGIHDIELWCYPDKDNPYLIDCSSRFNTDLSVQQGQDLGERMWFAFSQVLKRYRFGIIIGCDCPGISPELLDSASKKLTQGYDVVIGPAADGGYYLLGCNGARKELFTNISWGSSTVLTGTLDRIRDLKMRCYELEELWDIDRPEDLKKAGIRI